MIKIKASGSFDNTEKFIKHTSKYMDAARPLLERYGQLMCDMLRNATPWDTGETATSWRYQVSIKKDDARIYFHNDHVENGVNIALILQYGHATRQGGYVYGRDYLSQPYQVIFDRIAEELWREVSKL